MTNVLILHGTDATPNDNWFMWLKGKLVGQGYRVWLPQLPGADKPNAQTYTDFLLANKDFKINKDTVIVGHSSGAVAALHVLQHLPARTKIKGAILVSAFKDDLGWEKLGGLFEQPLDFEKIKKHCASFIYLHSDDDPYIALDQPRYLAEQTGGDVIVFQGQGHFNTDVGPHYKQFPEIIQFIEEVIE